MCLSLNSSSDRDERTQGLNRVRGSTCEQHCTRPLASPILRLFMQHCEEHTQRFRNITSKIIRNRILLLKSETEISSAVVNFKVPTIRTVGDTNRYQGGVLQGNSLSWNADSLPGVIKLSIAFQHAIALYATSFS